MQITPDSPAGATAADGELADQGLTLVAEDRGQMVAMCALAPKQKVRVTGPTGSTAPSSADRLDDEDYPAYTMGRAAEMIGSTPAFLRALGEARLIVPLRSEGGHRRYSRYQLRLAARAREFVDAGTPIEAACRIMLLEHQLEEARRIITELRGRPCAGA